MHATAAATTAERRRPRAAVEVGWLDVIQAMDYTGQTEQYIKDATHVDPVTGDYLLDHRRTTGKGKLIFRREWLDDWILRHDCDGNVAPRSRGKG